MYTQIRILTLWLCWVLFLPLVLSQQPVLGSADFQRQGNSQWTCDAVGTFSFGPFSGPSADLDSNTIFLCLGDTLFIDYNDDYTFACDSVPGLQPGIAWVIYNCPPTWICGDSSTLLSDPCLFPGAGPVGFWAQLGAPTGDVWLYNNGGLINSPIFGNGNSFQLFYAPATLADISSLEVGPCTNVNTADAFSVVYLSPVTEHGISNSFGDDCRGKFQIRGGFPKWDLNANYGIEITKVGKPYKGLIHNQEKNWRHGANIVFSVPRSGTYRVDVQDEKICDHSFEIDMAGCDVSDNVELSIPRVNALEGETICLPVQARNFANIISLAFSIAWDTSVLRYEGLDQWHPLVSTSDSITAGVDQGMVGVSFVDFVNSNGTTIPNSDTLFTICFEVVGALDATSPVEINNKAIEVIFDDANGRQPAVSAQQGKVTVRCKCPKLPD